MAISTADRNVVNEGSPAQVTINSFDFDGSGIAPTTLHYTIHDIRSGDTVKAETEIASPSAANLLSIPSSLNAILDPSLAEEPKRLTVIANKDIAAQVVKAQFTYYVKNMSYA